MSTYQIAGINMRLESNLQKDWMRRFSSFEFEQASNVDLSIRFEETRDFSFSEEDAVMVLLGKRVYQSEVSSTTIFIDEVTRAFKYAVTKDIHSHTYLVQIHSDVENDTTDFEFDLVGTLFEQAALDRGLLVVEASAVDQKGQAVVFIGPTGIGKSSLARRWVEAIPKSSWISDRLVFLERIESGMYLYTTPWTGLVIANKPKKVVVKALVHLDQASHDAIGSTQSLERMRYLLRSVRKQNDIIQSQIQTSLVQKIADQHPLVRYACTDTEDAAITLYQHLFK